MEIIASSMHRIDIDNRLVTFLPIDTSSDDLSQYLEDLQNDIVSKQSKRRYTFLRNTTEFCSSLERMYQAASSNTLTALNFAENLGLRLLDKEIASDEEMTARFGTRSHLKRGSFLQFYYVENETACYLGIKVEHSAFIDEEDFQLKVGMPVTDKSFKACKVSFDANGSPTENVIVYDTNTTAAVYWWREFLELKEYRNDSLNTERASKSVMGEVNSSLKRLYPRDHTVLRHAVVAAFRQTGGIDYNDFVDQVVGSYEPINQAAAPTIQKLATKLKTLPEKKGFDSQFQLVPSAVPYRPRKVTLHHDIDLIIKESAATNDKVWASELVDGRKVVMIESDDGFRQFPQKQVLCQD